MIGIWRWFLALLVVMGHLYAPWWPAAYGVFSFYLISGFLMSLILNERYRFSAEGIKTFWMNRILRLYPPYFLACLISLAIIWWIPKGFVTGINSKLVFPHSIYEVITNLDILGLKEVPDRSSLVPPAWSLSIELFYYIVISFWAAKNGINALIFLSLSILYLGVVYAVRDFDWWYRYFNVFAGALPFSIGVNLYWHKEKAQKWLNRYRWSHAFYFSLAL